MAAQLGGAAPDPPSARAEPLRRFPSCAAAAAAARRPAERALRGIARDALLGVDAMAFVPSACRASWWTELDAMTEGSEPRRFESALVDNRGREIAISCSVTRFATRERTLALVLARPV